MRIRIVKPERILEDPRRILFRAEWDARSWSVVRELVGERSVMLNGFGQLVAQLGLSDRPDVVDRLREIFLTTSYDALPQEIEW